MREGGREGRREGEGEGGKERGRERGARARERDKEEYAYICLEEPLKDSRMCSLTLECVLLL